MLACLEAATDADYIGEDVSQLGHALQCADLARASGDDELVLAALLHDLGHLVDPHAPSMEGLGTVDHEHLGADMLRTLGFSDRVVRLVAGHVDAKRYLASRNPDYRARLSPASARTLELQGGPMTTAQRASFEADPLFRDLLRVRGFDEGGKDRGDDVAPLESYRPMLVHHLRGDGS